MTDHSYFDVEDEMMETIMHRGQAELFTNETGDWFLRLRADNGEILATTEGHANKQDVIDVRDKYFWSFAVPNEAAEGL